MVCRRPPGFAEVPELTGNIRGAWGGMLHDMQAAEAASPDPFGLPATWQALFGQHGHVTRGVEVPKPFTFECDLDSAEMIIRLKLFGRADAWRETAFEALLQACEAGIAPVADQRHRFPLIITDAHWDRLDGLPVRPAGSAAALHFRTPLTLKRGRSFRGSMTELPFHLLSRVAAMARWQNTYLDIDWGAWRARSTALTVHDDRLRPVTWRRFSRRQPGRPIPMGGLLGTVTIAGDLADWSPVLAVAERIHAGSQSTLGLGRFDLSPLP